MRIHPYSALRQALAAYFPHAVVHGLDAQYATLTAKAWVGLHQEFASEMWGKGLPEWLVEKGDCDDWAWLFRAHIVERNWAQHKSRVPVALFYLHYTTAAGVYHAICAAIVRDGEHLTVLPIEPQPDGGPISLTREERESCNLIIG